MIHDFTPEILTSPCDRLGCEHGTVFFDDNSSAKCGTCGGNGEAETERCTVCGLSFVGCEDAQVAAREEEFRNMNVEAAGVQSTQLLRESVSR